MNYSEFLMTKIGDVNPSSTGDKIASALNKTALGPDTGAKISNRLRGNDIRTDKPDADRELGDHASAWSDQRRNLGQQSPLALERDNIRTKRSILPKLKAFNQRKHEKINSDPNLKSAITRMNKSNKEASISDKIASALNKTALGPDTGKRVVKALAHDSQYQSDGDGPDSDPNFEKVKGSAKRLADTDVGKNNTSVVSGAQNILSKRLLLPKLVAYNRNKRGLPTKETPQAKTQRLNRDYPGGSAVTRMTKRLRNQEPSLSDRITAAARNRE